MLTIFESNGIFQSIKNSNLGRRVFDGKFKDAVITKAARNGMNNKADQTGSDVSTMVAKYHRLDPSNANDNVKIHKLTSKYLNPNSVSNMYRKAKMSLNNGSLFKKN